MHRNWPLMKNYHFFSIFMKLGENDYLITSLPKNVDFLIMAIVYLVYSALLGPCAVDAVRVFGCCTGCLGSGSIAQLSYKSKLRTASTGYSKY